MPDENNQLNESPARSELPMKGFWGRVFSSVTASIIMLALAAVVSTASYYYGKLNAPALKLPIGTIVAWNGDGDLPDGWVKCDGSNNTPDMQDRFLKGVIPPTQVKKFYDNGMIARMSNFPLLDPNGPTKLGTVANITDGQPLAPNSYSVFYIMKVK